jgi:hypothetical protein
VPTRSNESKHHIRRTGTEKLVLSVTKRLIGALQTSRRGLSAFLLRGEVRRSAFLLGGRVKQEVRTKDQERKEH